MFLWTREHIYPKGSQLYVFLRSSPEAASCPVCIPKIAINLSKFEAVNFFGIACCHLMRFWSWEKRFLDGTQHGTHETRVWISFVILLGYFAGFVSSKAQQVAFIIQAVLPWDVYTQCNTRIFTVFPISWSGPEYRTRLMLADAENAVFVAGKVSLYSFPWEIFSTVKKVWGNISRATKQVELHERD